MTAPRWRPTSGRAALPHGSCSAKSAPTPRAIGTKHTIPRHLSARDLVRSTDDMGVPLDETTIHRTVIRLEELDLIYHVTIPDQANRYGLNTPTPHRALDRTQL